MSTTNPTAAVILAAGTSSRMKEGEQGRHKLLLPLGGKPVIEHVIQAVIQSRARPVVIVLGHEAEKVQASLSSFEKEPDVLFVENPDYEEGLSTSMQVGIQELIYNGYTQEGMGALFVLGDTPTLTPAIINRLIEAREETGKGIVVPLYGGKRGNPILFDDDFFPELMNVTGDEGGRSVRDQYPEDMAMVEVGDLGENFDVDTWEAYQEVVAMWQLKALD